MNKLKPLIRNYGSGVMEAGFLDKDGNFLREMSIFKEEDIDIFYLNSILHQCLL